MAYKNTKKQKAHVRGLHHSGKLARKRVRKAEEYKKTVESIFKTDKKDV